MASAMPDQNYGKHRSRRASPPLDRYDILLLGDRGTRVQTTCPESGTTGTLTRELLSRKSNALTISPMPPGRTVR